MFICKLASFYGETYSKLSFMKERSIEKKVFFSGFWAQKEARTNFQKDKADQQRSETGNLGAWKLKKSGPTCERYMSKPDT